MYCRYSTYIHVLCWRGTQCSKHVSQLAPGLGKLSLPATRRSCASYSNSSYSKGCIKDLQSAALSSHSGEKLALFAGNMNSTWPVLSYCTFNFNGLLVYASYYPYFQVFVFFFFCYKHLWGLIRPHGCQTLAHGPRLKAPLLAWLMNPTLLHAFVGI